MLAHACGAAGRPRRVEPTGPDDDFTGRALAFIEANRRRPFFCYVPYNTPHSPMQVPDRWWDEFEDKRLAMHHRDPQRENIPHVRAALAMCENIDWNVGRILEKLDALQIAENTIVVYFSDNGPNSFRWNGGMKGKKGSIDEGGLRSPFFIRWPERWEFLSQKSRSMAFDHDIADIVVGSAERE